MLNREIYFKRTPLVIPLGILACCLLALAVFYKIDSDCHALALTTNTIPKAASAATLGDSAITDDATTVAMSEPLSMASHQIHNVTDPSSAQDAATQAYVLAHNGTMAIGGSVTGGTANSILFVGAGPVLAQDNARFSWTDTPGYMQLKVLGGNNGLANGYLTHRVQRVDRRNYHRLRLQLTP